MLSTSSVSFIQNIYLIRLVFFFPIVTLLLGLMQCLPNWLPSFYFYFHTSLYPQGSLNSLFKVWKWLFQSHASSMSMLSYLNWNNIHLLMTAYKVCVTLPCPTVHPQLLVCQTSWSLSFNNPSVPQTAHLLPPIFPLIGFWLWNAQMLAPSLRC